MLVRLLLFLEHCIVRHVLVEEMPIPAVAARHLLLPYWSDEGQIVALIWKHMYTPKYPNKKKHPVAALKTNTGTCI